MNARAPSPEPLFPASLAETLTLKHGLFVTDLVAYAAHAPCVPSECDSQKPCAPCRARAFLLDFIGAEYTRDGEFVRIDQERRVAR